MSKSKHVDGVQFLSARAIERMLAKRRLPKIRTMADVAKLKHRQRTMLAHNLLRAIDKG